MLLAEVKHVCEPLSLSRRSESRVWKSLSNGLTSVHSRGAALSIAVQHGYSFDCLSS